MTQTNRSDHGPRLGNGTEQVPAVAPPPSASTSEWRIDRQSADTIHNAGRDQYNNYYSQQRESFLREVAAAKTKARRVVWVGFGVFCIGLVVAAVGWASAQNGIMSGDESNVDAAFESFNAGYAVFALGGAIYAAGAITMVVGLVLHIVAAARRRRGEAEFGSADRGPATPVGRP
jgi:hypothetical protein